MENRHADAEETRDQPLGIAVVGVNNDGEIVHASPGIEDLLGWPAPDLIGQQLRVLIPQRFHGPHMEGFTRFVTTGKLGLVGRTVAIPALTPTGEERDIEFVLSVPSHNDDASVIGVIRSVQSVDDNARAKLRSVFRLALTVDRSATESLIEALAIIGQAGAWRVASVWIVDPWSRCLRVAATWAETSAEQVWRAAATENTLLDRGDGIAGTVWETGRPEWIPDLEIGGTHHGAMFCPLLTDGEVVGVLELLDVSHDGLSIDREENLWALADELARFVGAQSRRDAEETHRQRIQLALSARGMGLWTHRIATGVVTWDAQMERLHGMEPGSYSGTYEDYSGRVNPDDLKEMEAAIVAAVTAGKDFSYRCRVQRSDGVEIWLEGTGLPIFDRSGQLVELTGVSYDITDDVRARQELIERVNHAALAADVGRAFVGDASLVDKLQRTTESMVTHLDAAFARIWMLTPGSDTLELMASAGLYTHLDGGHARIRVGDFKIGRIAATNEPHLSNDVLNDDQISDPEWAAREGMRAFAGYPLVIGDRTVGVLALFAQHTLAPTTLRALGAIADTIAIGIDQTRTALEVLELYEQTRRHAEALETALVERSRVAAILQRSLLPPSLPDIEGFALQARYEAGVDEVGGDFYDVFPLAHNRWAFMVGDICGSGPEAASLTALSRHSLRTALILGQQPAEALRALNEALLRSNDDDGRFCTAVCGILHSADDEARVELASAGHPPSMLVRPDSTVEQHRPKGVLLGIFADAQFDQTTIYLTPGASLVLYTDGVTEAGRATKQLGVEGLVSVLESLPSTEAKTIVDAVVEAVAERHQDAPDDDLAILVLHHLIGANS